MKKEFLTPIIEIIFFKTDDIITSSSVPSKAPTESRDDMNGGWSPWH